MTAGPCAFPGAEWEAGIGREVESVGMNKNLEDREEKHFVNYL